MINRLFFLGEKMAQLGLFKIGTGLALLNGMNRKADPSRICRMMESSVINEK